MEPVEIPPDHRRTPSSPRVRPRARIEDLVSRQAHPPRRKIATDEEADDRLHWTSWVAVVALAVFWTTAFASGLSVALGGYQVALGWIVVATASLVVHYRIEAE